MVDYAKLAEALGVELGDQFVPENWDYVSGFGKYKITESGIKRFEKSNRWVDINEESETIYKVNDFLAIMGAIVSGKKGIKMCYQSVFNCGDEYWSYAGNDWSITKYTWTDSMEDQARRNMHAAFSKEYIAVRNRPALYKRITGKEWIDS